MDSSQMRFEVTDSIGHLTIDRPEQRKAMTWAMYGACELAREIAAAPPITLRVTKEAIRRVVHRLRPEDPGHDLLGRYYNSADFQEGATYWILIKREPYREPTRRPGASTKA